MTSFVVTRREKPILFSGAMVRAILNGSKTQTRRACKIQWDEAALHESYPELLATCPYGQFGDFLWVRETWGEVLILSTSDSSQKTEIIYRAENENYDRFGMVGGGWRPSIYMPRKASRITLEVANVRIERLQDITEEDAIAEGGLINQELPVSINGEEPTAMSLGTGAIDLFAKLWDSINADRGYGWKTNPWVWIVEFKKLEEGRKYSTTPPC